jgi:hypothetical protein
MGIALRSSSPSRRRSSLPGRPDGKREDGLRRARGTSYERRRKRSRSGSHDRKRVRQLRDPGVDERTSRGDRSEIHNLTNSSAPSSPAPHSRVVKGKEKAGDLGRVTNGLGPPASGSEAEWTTTDEGVGNAQIREPPIRNTRSLTIPNVGTEIEHQKHSLYVNPSKLIYLYRKPNRLRLVALPLNPGARTPGPDLRHGRRSLLERISGMEEVPHQRLVSVSAVHLDVSISPDPARPRRSAAAQPERSGAASSNINLGYRGRHHRHR